MLKEKILIVDDDPFGCRATIRVLLQQGYDTDFATTGKEAIDKAKDQNPSLIFLDIMMPDINGLEVLEILRKEPSTSSIPIIMLTGRFEQDCVVAAMEKGADDYMVRPYEPKVLIEKTEFMLAVSKKGLTPSQLKSEIRQYKEETKSDKYVILIVDDEENNLNSLSRLFSHQSEYKIVIANSAKLALDKISGFEKVDLVISDQRMPQMSGIELLKEIKERYPGSIRILLSGHTDVEALIGAINEGEVSRFVEKPLNNQDLVILVKHLLERRDIHKVISQVFIDLRREIEEKGDMEIDSYHDGKKLHVRAKGKGKIISQEAFAKILDLVLGEAITKITDSQNLSGVVSKNKGKITLTFDTAEEAALLVELPVKTADKGQIKQ